MLPKTVPGSVDFYKENFEKAMAIIQKVIFSLNSLLKCAFQTGKPDLFITFTGNPQWKEIQVRVSLLSNLQSDLLQENLLPGCTWQDDPFLTADVFYMKMKAFLSDIVDRELFGPVLSYSYSIEFQKRGMPHMHLLLTLKVSLILINYP